LLQAALRAGDESAHRLDSRRIGDVAGLPHRPRGQFAVGDTGTCAPPACPAPDSRQRAADRAQAHGLPWLEDNNHRPDLAACRRLWIVFVPRPNRPSTMAISW